MPIVFTSPWDPANIQFRESYTQYKPTVQCILLPESSYQVVRELDYRGLGMSGLTAHLCSATPILGLEHH